MVTIDRITLGCSIDNLVAKVTSVRKDGNAQNTSGKEKTQKATTTRGRTLIVAELADPTGRVSLLCSESYSAVVKPGRVLHICGRATCYAGRLQVQVGDKWGSIRKAVGNEGFGSLDFSAMNHLSESTRRYGVLLVRKDCDGVVEYLLAEDDHDHHEDHDHHGQTLFSVPTEFPSLRDTEKDAATRALINATSITEYDFVLLHQIPPILIPSRSEGPARYVYVGFPNPGHAALESNAVWADLEKIKKGQMHVHPWVQGLLDSVAALPSIGDVAATQPPAAAPAKKKVDKLPVTVLSGFLGVAFPFELAGKTTLLNSILNNTQNLRICVIVNDMGEVNIDFKLIENDGFTRVDEKLVELTNGCICCTLREDLLEQVAQLASANKFDYLLIESSGISEPLPVAETFEFTTDLPGHRTLMEVARLDTMVTLVDSVNFLRDFWTSDTLRKRDLNATPTDARHVVDLLRDQVEFANVLVMTKTDLVPEHGLRKLEAILTSLNPTAKILSSSRGDLDPSTILNTGFFSLEKARMNKDWLVEPRYVRLGTFSWFKGIMSSHIPFARGTHVPETLEYNISHTTFTSRTPFHPLRLWNLVHRSTSDLFQNVLRSKGDAAKVPHYMVPGREHQ
ncbi:hypothetical protein HDU88_001700 [Geranomyces variabilis]|nr:hypothetical protein HDU88_001700 [Geranomyces variabilis]